MKIAVIGATLIDLVSYVDTMPEYGSTTRAKNFHIACGGKGANQAIAASRLGADILMVSTVGDDIFGQMARENFVRNNIAPRHVVTVPNITSGAVMIIVDKSGQYNSVFYPGASNALTPEKLLNVADDLKKCSMFVIQLEIPLETVYAAIDLAVANKIPVVLNPSPINEKFSAEAACKCDFVVVNEIELNVLTRMPADTRENILAAGKYLLSHGLKNLIVTCGADGSIFMTKDKVEFIPTLKVEAIDSTGAGDAYIGCFVETYARTGKVIESIQRASKYAALSVTRKGTQDSYLAAEEFENILATLERDF